MNIEIMEANATMGRGLVTLSQTSKKVTFLFLSFMSFLLQNQRVLWWGWHQWEGGYGMERSSRVNIRKIMYTHVCKCKNDTY
jgi:hypothetical protein